VAHFELWDKVARNWQMSVAAAVLVSRRPVVRTRWVPSSSYCT